MICRLMAAYLCSLTADLAEYEFRPQPPVACYATPRTGEHGV